MLERIQGTVLRLMGSPPPPAMTVDNLYGYLDALYQRRDLPGPVVEVGMARGGTTVLACRFLSRIGAEKDYWCFDTFSGFVDEQVETDRRLGLPRANAKLFRANSRERVRRTLERLDIARHVHLVEGDICELDPDRIPDGISVALLDVDLRDPIREGLAKLHPKLAPGGVILVDDCKAGTSWVGASVGYEDFVAEQGLEPRYFLGFGVVEKPAPGVDPLPWTCSPTPNPVEPNFFGR
jgi:O-methyltransferase